ncbi:hypothetical protein ACXYL9_00765 [Qipengyuania sp. CAU 1752]
MALVVLLTVGAVMGWLASILWKQDTLRLSLVNMALGAASALLCNMALGFQLESTAIHSEALWVGAACAVVAVSITALLRRRFG